MQTNIQEYIGFLRATMAASSVKLYSFGLERWLNWVLEQGINDIDQLPNTALQDYVIHEIEKGRKPGTVQLVVVAVKKYLKWAQEHGYLKNVFLSPKLPRDHNKLAQVLTDEQLVSYMNAANHHRDPARTLIQLLPMTGMRINEVCTLKLDAIIKIAAKSGSHAGGVAFKVLRSDDETTTKSDERIVPVLPQGNQLIISYLKWRMANHDGSDWLFPSKKSGKGHAEPRTIELYVKRMRPAVGALKMTPHTLRHTYASFLKRAGFSDIEIARILGHRNLATTARYVHFQNDDLMRDLSKVPTPWIKENR